MVGSEERPYDETLPYVCRLELPDDGAGTGYLDGLHRLLAGLLGGYLGFNLLLELLGPLLASSDFFSRQSPF